MGKTFDQSLIDTANIPMSMIDPEDMADTSSEEFLSMRRVQQGCHNELTNREDFPFNMYTKSIATAKGQSTLGMVDGRVTKVRININNKLVELPYVADAFLLEEKSGVPTCYTVTSNPEKIKLYPTPDKSYNVGIEYMSTKNIELSDGNYSYTIQTGSTLRMPERYQHLYFDALEYYVLCTNMRKVSNPRWQPTQGIFQEKWNTFLRGCSPVDADTTFTI